MAHYCTYRSNRSPPKKTPLSPDAKQVPFRSANPSQLQEVTLATPLEYLGEGTTSSNLFRLAAGRQLSPIRGRTMKEYDQQIAELKNENFNLKLRIYFLEERIQHQFGDSSNDVFKNNIELKVEVESLKKELADRQELLVKASNALEVLETTRKTEKTELEQQFAEHVKGLEGQIQRLQQALENGVHDLKSSQYSSDDSSRDELYKQAFPPLPSAPNLTQRVSMTDFKAKVDELQSTVDSLNSNLSESQNHIQVLENQLREKEKLIQEEDLNNLKRNKLIQGLVTAVKTKEKQITQLQAELEGQASELKSAKEQLNGVLKGDTEPSVFSRLSPNAAAGDCRDQSGESTKTDLHESDLEELCREKQQLEVAWRDAVKQRDETIQAMQADLQNQLQSKEELVRELRQAIADRDDVLLDCLKLVGDLDALEHTKELSSEKITEVLKIKILEKESKVQTLFEEKMKLLKEKENELTKESEASIEKDQSFHQKVKDTTAAQQSVTTLQKELEVRDVKIEELLEFVRTLRSQIEESLKIVGDKDSMINRLQKSLLDTDKKLEDMCVSQGSTQCLASNSIVVENRITEKDKLIEVLISEKSKCLLETEKMTQNYSTVLQDKDAALKEAHSRLINEQVAHEVETDQLKAELKKKVNEIKNLTNQQQILQEKLQAVLSAKVPNFESKTEANTDGEDSPNLISFNSPVCRPESLVTSLTKETEALREKLQAKEAFILHLKEYLEKLLHDTDDKCTSKSRNTASSSDTSDAAVLDQKLSDVEARLKSSWNHNKQLQSQLTNLRTRIAQIKADAQKGNRANNSLLSVSHELVDGDVEDELQSLQVEVKMLANVNNLFQRQIELNSEIRGSFNPKLIIEMAVEIQRLTATLERRRTEQFSCVAEENQSTPYQKFVFGPPAQPLKKLSPVVDCSVLTESVHQENSRFSFGDEPSRMQTSMMVVLQDAQHEIKLLQEKLASTENTVHVLGNKVKYYRQFLVEAGISPPSPANSRVECVSPGAIGSGGLSHESEAKPCKADSTQPVGAASQRSVSADELRVVPANITLNQDSQALSADDILTTEQEVTSNSTMCQPVCDKNQKVDKFQSSIEKSTHSQQNKCSHEDFHSCSKKDCPCLKHVFEDVVQTETQIYVAASPYTPDSVAEYGQSNDILELKEQICWLKLRLEERDVQIQGLLAQKDVIMTKMNVTLPTALNRSESIYLNEQSLTFSGRNTTKFVGSIENSRSPCANQTLSYNCAQLKNMVDAECQVGDGVHLQNSVVNSNSVNDEVQWLRHQNTVLETKLSSLIEVVPGERSHISQWQHQEIAVLRQRLLESHDSSETLRVRLEELAEFLEQLLQFDENGILDASRLTPQRIASLRRHIAESRELSYSLSHSLLVDLDISLVSSIDRVTNQTQSTTVVTDDEADVTCNRTCRTMELNSTIRNSPFRDNGIFGKPKSVLEAQQSDSTVSGLSLTKLRSELSVKNDVVIRLRSEIHLLREQIRQRDIENAWNQVDRQSKTRAPSSIFSDRTVEKARSTTHSFLTTANAVPNMDGDDTLNISLLGDEQLPPNEASCISPEKELEWRSGSTCQPFVSELNRRDHQPNLEALWLNSNNDNDDSHSDDMKPLQSSYDDLILLLDAEQDPSAHAVRISSKQRFFQDEQKLPAESSGHVSQPDNSNPEIRTLEAQQEQAIMAEYVRHYTSRPFVDENTHSTFRAMAAVLSPTDQLPEKERSIRSRPRITATPSDSESWSEPDRDVSQQRMGLEPDASGEKSGVLGRSPKTCVQRLSGSGSSNVDASSEEMVRISKRLYSPSGRKSRSDPWDLRRLLARLQNLEELNATLRSELQIHQSLSKDICNSSQRQSVSLIKVSQDDKIKTSSSALLHVTERRKSADTVVDKTGLMLQEHLEEIRALRIRLEESIQINDQLQEKLAKRLAAKQVKDDVKFGKENNEEVDQLCNQLELKNQMITELQQQVEYYLKLAPRQDAEVQQLKQQVYELSSKIQDLEDQVPQLQRELTAKDEASQQLKSTNQRLQGSLVNMQTALMDKDRVNKEVREANSRMQRALDAVNKLMQQRDVELRTAQSQRDQLDDEIKAITQKHNSELGKLTAFCNEKAKEIEDKENLCRESALQEVREIRQRHREDMASLQKVLEEKLKRLNEALHSLEELKEQLMHKEEESQVMRKKFDEMSVAVMELEKQLEREHGQCLSLQQKLNVQSKALFEKENLIFSLQDKLQEHQTRMEETEQRCDVSHNQLVKLQATVASSQHESAEREQELVSLRKKMENLQEILSEKKRALDTQVDKAHSLEQKIDRLNALSSAKEERFHEEETISGQLRDSLNNLEKQFLDTKNELKKSQDSCKQTQNRLLEQEKMYMSLQGKLDERSTSIRKLEEELHQAWEDNEKLQQQVLALQTRLQETSDLNKSMKTELNVYEHLHASISSCNPASTGRRASSSKQASLDLNLLLQEIRSLRSQLELSIQTNCALRAQLEEQFNSRCSDVTTVEIPLVRSAKSKENAKDSKKGSSRSYDKNPVPCLERVSSAPSSPFHFYPEKDNDSNDERKKRNRLSWNESPTEDHMDSDDAPQTVKLLKPHLADSGNFSEHDCHSKVSFARQQSKSSDYVSEDPAGVVDERLPSSCASYNKTQQKTQDGKTSTLCLILPEANDRVGREEVINGQTDSHSIYSSPDLGIESDPNHFSSLERKMTHITDDHLWQIRETWRKHNQSEKLANVSYSIYDPYPQVIDPQVGIDSDRRLLYAIGRLDDYELLKKEVEESLVVLKGVQSRLKDSLKTCPKASPMKSLEQVTLKELQNSSANLQICLGKSLDIIGCFWTAMLPQEAGSLVENKKLCDEIIHLKKKFHQQKKTLNAALQKLAATNRLKEGMEKAITKQLSKTHDVLKKAKVNLADNSVKEVQR